MVAMPAMPLRARPTAGAPRAVLANLAADGQDAVRRPAQGMKPIAYMAAGRRLPL